MPLHFDFKQFIIFMVSCIESASEGNESREWTTRVECFLAQVRRGLHWDAEGGKLLDSVDCLEINAGLTEVRGGQQDSLARQGFGCCILMELKQRV